MLRAPAVIAAVAVLSVGAAHAAPGFGASSHRLGGGTQGVEARKDPMPWVVALLGIIGIDLTAKVEPVVGDTLEERRAKARQCDEAKNAEMAKADEQTSAKGDRSKGRSRNGDPVYLAF